MATAEEIQDIIKKNNETLMNQLREELKTMKTEITSLQAGEIDKLRKEINSTKFKLGEKYTAVVEAQTKLQTKVDKLEASSIMHLTEAVAEMEERARRASNLIAKGLTEATATTPKDRSAQDRVTALQIVTSLEPSFKPADLLRVTRSGKFTEDRRRPLKLVLSSPEIAKNVLRKPRDSLPQGVKLNSDLTLNQQAELVELRSTLAERRKQDPTAELKPGRETTKGSRHNRISRRNRTSKQDRFNKQNRLSKAWTQVLPHKSRILTTKIRPTDH